VFKVVESDYSQANRKSMGTWQISSDSVSRQNRIEALCREQLGPGMGKRTQQDWRCRTL